MEELKELNNQLYGADYGIPKVGDFETIWNSIKNRTEILEEAIQVTRNKWNNGDTVKAVSISEAILVDFENVNQEVYQQLVNTIYTNQDIARISIHEPDGGQCYSFLLMTLWNFNLQLTEEQKEFAAKEAMIHSGTIKDLSPSVCAVHGHGIFDIRYWILRNPNWTLEEKQELVMRLWDDDDFYDDTLEQWEWSIVNDHDNYQGEAFPPFDRYELFNEWDYDRLLQHHKNKEITDRIWGEMEFCKQMHQLRPQQWEKPTEVETGTYPKQKRNTYQPTSNNKME